MLSTVTHEQAAGNIKQGIEACQKLLILLEDERNALKKRDTKELERIITDKSTSLIALEQGAKQRAAWITTNGKEPSPEHAWTQHIEQLGSDMAPQWQQFKRLLEDCQTHNEVNGKMLARNQQAFKRLIAIVRGQSHGQPLYTPKGSHGAGSGYHNLGEA